MVRDNLILIPPPVRAGVTRSLNGPRETTLQPALEAGRRVPGWWISALNPDNWIVFGLSLRR